MSEDRKAGELVLRSIMAPEFQTKITQSLPAGVDVARFSRVTITALQRNPDLLNADRNSLYLAILACAQAGLEPDGKDAALVAFKREVQFMPMVGGIIKRLGGCGIGADTQVVYENDEFECEFGDNPYIHHRPPKLGAERGKMVGAYAILRGPGVMIYREIMDAAQIEAVRAQSKAPNGLMWTKFESEAWRKTVLRRCAKRVAINVDAPTARTLDADNATFDMREEMTLAPVQDQTEVVAEQPSAQGESGTDKKPLPQEPQHPQNLPRRPRALAEVVARPDTDDEF